jgi:hypothetical protein
MIRADVKAEDQNNANARPIAMERPSIFDTSKEKGRPLYWATLSEFRSQRKFSR